MRNLKEVRPLLSAIYCINRTGSKDEDIEKILDYAFTTGESMPSIKARFLVTKS